MKNFLFYSFCLLYQFSFSQFLCFNEEEEPGPQFYPAICDLRDNYSPILSEHNPIITVRIAFHVFQKNDGTANFQNNTTDKQYLQNIVNNANSRLSNLGALNIGNSPYIQDSRIRLLVDKIYFHPHDEDVFFNPSTSSSIYIKYVVNDYDNYAMTSDDKNNVQHIFLRGEDFSTGGGRQVGGLGMQGHLVHNGFYNHYLQNGFNSSHYGPVGNFIHELGHAFGLYHNFHAGSAGNQCDDCTDNDPVNLPCPIQASSNNYLDYFPGGYASIDPGFSQQQLSKIRWYLAGVNGTIHRVVLKDYCVVDAMKNIEINGSHTWNSHKILRGNLIINADASLTVKCKIHMPEGGKIIVKQGGKLIVDEGIITNECNQFWQGIEVWGTSNQHQYPFNNSTYQGMLILKNGGTIENAHTAAVNWKQDDFSKIGGIIQSTDGVFKNNRRDVAFMSYSNFLASNPSVKVPNLSFFKNTDFVSDNNFIEKGYAMQKHVTLWAVSGINFTNCHFSNEITTNKSNSSAPNGAIFSIDAGFKVFAGCSTSPPFGQACPSSNLLKSSFSGFSKAVEITGTSTTETVTIQQSEFINNINGIGVDEFDNISINRNEIEIGNAGYVFSWPALFVGTGINANNSTGYIIEENKISTNLTVGQRSGINITNGGEGDHRLYKNTLDGLTIGTNARGVNHNSNYQRGLQFLCNAYKNNATAIQIQTSPTSDGVRFYQGDFSPNKASGNTFVNNTKGIVNNTNSLVYYHKGLNSLPLNNSGLISIYEATNPNTCPTSFGGGIIIMRPLALLLEDLEDLTEEHNDLNYTYISLIDGGNTEQFKNNIEINWSDDAWLLREKLIGKSPYLSSEVLLKTAERNILPNGMLLEVLLANPDATRGELFIKKLKDITNNSFPEYMLNYVRNNWDTKTLRTNLEGQMSSVNSDLSTTRNFIKYLKKSEDETTYDDRFKVAKMGNTISHKVGLMDFFIENNQFTKADSVLQAVMNDKAMKDELKQVEYYEDYLSFRSSIDGRNLAQLDSNEINYLQTLAENSGRAAGYAQNILCFFYDICYEEQFDNGDIQSKSMSIATNTAELESIMYNITVYPNPSEEFTSVKWEIYDQLQNAQYKVFDLNGNEVASSLIDNNKGEKVIDTRSLRNGIYIIGIYNNDEVKANKKLVVNHKN